MEARNLIPATIFCPKCGNKLNLVEIKDPLERDRIIKAEYSQGARGACGCGVMAVFLTKPLPVNPTFTILFNVYKEGGE